MNPKKMLLILGVAIVLLIGGLLVSKFVATSETQEGLRDAADSASLQSCKDIRKNICLTSNTITEADYPESCFNSGENILEDPYQCPN